MALEAVWTPERHFHDFGGLYPSPSVAGAAIAAVTERVGMRAGSVVLPLHALCRSPRSGPWSTTSPGAGWGSPSRRAGTPTTSSCARGLPAPQGEDVAGIEKVRKLWRGETVQGSAAAANSSTYGSCRAHPGRTADLDHLRRHRADLPQGGRLRRERAHAPLRPGPGRSRGEDHGVPAGEGGGRARRPRTGHRDVDTPSCRTTPSRPGSRRASRSGTTSQLHRTVAHLFASTGQASRDGRRGPDRRGDRHGDQPLLRVLRPVRVPGHLRRTGPRPGRRGRRRDRVPGRLRCRRTPSWRASTWVDRLRDAQESEAAEQPPTPSPRSANGTVSPSFRAPRRCSPRWPRNPAPWKRCGACAPC